MAQRFRRWSSIVQMLYKYFVFAGSHCDRIVLHSIQSAYSIQEEDYVITSH